MTATASHTGASISPDPAAAADYTGPVTYTVSAADGTSRAYTVTVHVVKIASVTAVNGNFSAPHGLKTGLDISGAVKAAITSVTGTDSLGNTITLAAADYSVDPLFPNATGANAVATLRVPAAKSSTGGDITEDFTVYIKKDAKEITEFYFTLDSKKYGVGDGVESGSGSISGNAVTVIVPYDTDLRDLTPAITVSAGASVDPQSGTAGDFSSDKTYTVTAEDDTTKTYTVTVNMRPGITISGITVKGLSALTFSGVSPSVAREESITITISDGLIDVIADSWYVDISGPASSSSTVSSIVFSAPATPGFYNVNVIATVGDVDYSGSFGLIVQ
jgi:hypothetical protein